MSLSEEEIRDVIQMYEGGLSAYAIAKKCDMKPGRIYWILKKNGIERRSNKVNSRKYDVNHDYFEVIDTENKAYWLGFLYADGYVTRKQYVGLALHVKDKDHIVKFKNDIESEHPIATYRCETSYGKTEYARLCFVSPKMCNDLIKHGCILSKTLSLEPPLFLDSSLISAFIRGYFDGDGCVTTGGRKNPKMTIVGNKEILQWMNEQLPAPGPLQFDRRKPYVAEIYNTDTKAIINLEWIYADAKIFLDRKHKKALAHIGKFYSSD